MIVKVSSLRLRAIVKVIVKVSLLRSGVVVKMLSLRPSSHHITLGKVLEGLRGIENSNNFEAFKCLKIKNLTIDLLPLSFPFAPIEKIKLRNEKSPKPTPP